MKNKIINIVSAVILTISIVLIIRYFVVSANNNKHRQPVYTESKEYDLTESECLDCDIDLGKVKSGTMLSQKYILKNIGDHPLVVKSISPDCHCTDFKISQYTAAPRDSIIITLFVDTNEKKLGETTLNTVVQTNTEKEYHLLKLMFDLVENQ